MPLTPFHITVPAHGMEVQHTPTPHLSDHGPHTATIQSIECTSS